MSETEGGQTNADDDDVASGRLFSIAVNVRLADKETPTFGVANKTALYRKVDAWTQALH
jgi:hypothetical protein